MFIISATGSVPYCFICNYRVESWKMLYILYVNGHLTLFGEEIPNASCSTQTTYLPTTDIYHNVFGLFVILYYSYSIIYI